MACRKRDTYQHLSDSAAAAIHESAEYYRAYLDKTVQLELPDPVLQQAYDWARISTIQGMVNNPYLGTGLVAGYRTSGVGQRPGFAWFFGRDSLWTSFALNAEGDYATTRTAIDFISKYQREDGKDPARNFAERGPGSLVQRLSVSLRLRGCDAAIHPRHE